MSSSANVPVSSLDLLEPAMAGRLPAIARLLTRAESGAEEVYEALSELYRHTGKAHVVGITGVPGSGKSTLLAKLAREIRRSGRRVGIVAVDPTSPFSGGAILGDRIRMNELAADPGVFVRSMAPMFYWQLLKIPSAWKNCCAAYRHGQVLCGLRPKWFYHLTRTSMHCRYLKEFII